MSYKYYLQLFVDGGWQTELGDILDVDDVFDIRKWYNYAKQVEGRDYRFIPIEEVSNAK